MRPKRPVAARFWEKVDKGDGSGCWPWTAYLSDTGYGRFQVRQGLPVLAHRFAVELTRGPIPQGMTVDHLCFNPACCRPDHLEVVTGAENSRRRHRRSSALGGSYGRSHALPPPPVCCRGHELTVKTMRINTDKGRWDCRRCDSERDKARRDRMRTLDEYERWLAAQSDIAVVRHEALERMRVNAGLVTENQELRRQLASVQLASSGDPFAEVGEEIVKAVRAFERRMGR